MSIRDEEIRRLERYSQGLGCPVRWTEYRRDGEYMAAVVVGLDGNPSHIEICTWPGQSKTTIILNFLHELGHHLSWIYNGRKDNPRLASVLRKEADGHELTKEDRRVIYEMEKHDSNYREFVYNEVGIKLPKWKLKLDIQLDNWVYKYWWRKGTFPTQDMIKEKKRLFKQRMQNAGEI